MLVAPSSYPTYILYHLTIYSLNPTFTKFRQFAGIPIMHLVMAFMAEANHIPTGQLPLWKLLNRIDMVHRCGRRGPTIPPALPAHVFIPPKYPFALSLPCLGFIDIHTVTSKTKKSPRLLTYKFFIYCFEYFFLTLPMTEVRGFLGR